MRSSSLALVALLSLRPRFGRLDARPLGGAHCVAAGRRALDARRHAAARVGLYQGDAAAGVAGAVGRRLAEHAGGRLARRRTAVGLGEVAAGRVGRRSRTKLSETWDASAYRFDANTAPLRIERRRSRTAARTRRASNRRSARRSTTCSIAHASGRVLGVLLLSDGAQRAVAPHDLPPQVAVRRMAAENIPLYTFTFGKSGGSDRADLAIDDLVTNETIFAEAPTEVRGQLTAPGFANQRVAVQLLWENADQKMEVVDTVQVDTQAGNQSQPIVLRLHAANARRIQSDASRRTARGRARHDQQRSQHVCHGPQGRRQRALPCRREADRRRAGAGAAVRSGGARPVARRRRRAAAAQLSTRRGRPPRRAREQATSTW